VHALRLRVKGGGCVKPGHKSNLLNLVKKRNMQKLADVSEEFTALIIRTMIGGVIMGAAGSSETSVRIYKTTRYSAPPDSRLHVCIVEAKMVALHTAYLSKEGMLVRQRLCSCQHS
jgi:hypothetical protein